MSGLVLPAGALVHVVLFSFRDNATQEDREWTLSTYQRLDEACGGAEAGIFYWRFGPNRDLRKNWRMIEVAIFRDERALQAFRAHPAHVAAGERLRMFADWAVGDIEAL